MAESQNPLREGLRMQRTPQPNTVIIFGASGDLTKRKLVPAFYNLELERLCPQASRCWASPDAIFRRLNFANRC